MLAYLKGKIKFKGQNFFILENQGVGYKIFVPLELLLKIKEKEEIELFVYHYVREDANQLYGFLNYEELELFESLNNVSGIGPKTALSVFSVANVADIKSAIVNANPDLLKKVSGIGAKTAERIILELKNKIKTFEQVKSSDELNADADAIDALVSLGYEERKAREALRNISPTTKDTGDRVKEVLRILNSKS